LVLFSSLKHWFYFPDKEFYRSLKNLLGFRPVKLELYKKAFIHKSASLIKADGKLLNNERLEYLGDAILDAIIADYLFHKYPEEKEGELTRMRSEIVSGHTLATLAKKTGIDHFVVTKVGKSDQVNNVFADALEALIGATYLDRGYKRTRAFVVSRLIEKYIDTKNLDKLDTNHKSKLIEWSQKKKQKIEFLTREVIPKKADKKKPVSFVCQVKLNGKTITSAKGKTKRDAEQKASKKALKRIN
jgi:ribonuclease-3